MALNIKMPVRLGGNGEPNLGHENAQLVAALHGKHYEDTMAGRVFSQTPTPIGLAIPIYTATALAGAQPIWNPAGSGVNVELISTTISPSATGTAAVMSVGLMARTDVGSVIGTGQEITAFAETDPTNGILGGGNASQVKSSNAGTVTVSAGVDVEFVRSISGGGPETQAATNALVHIHHDYDGTVIVPPGVLVWVAGVLASVRLYVVTNVWKEIPI